MKEEREFRLKEVVTWLLCWSEEVVAAIVDEERENEGD